MANENVKIIVQEVDETRPRGSGPSSDVVYVPGMCNEFVSAEYRNVPILCSSVDEFESYFGSEPYQFEADENSYGVRVHPGDYDKGYIYAKELINSGLTVLYEAIVPDTNALVNIADFTSSSNTLSKVNNTKNVFVHTKEEKETVIVSFKLDKCYPSYGNVSLLVKSGTGVEATIKGLSESNESPKFPIEAGTGTYIINWELSNSITDSDIEDTTFIATLDVTGKGKLSLNLVVGDVSASVATVDSHLQNFYTQLPDRLENLTDKNEYTVKYITSGGYPTFIKDADGGYTLASKMISVAAKRNDSVALIDHNDNPSAELSVSSDKSIYHAANEYFSGAGAANAEFGAMFTPWGDYNCLTMTGSSAVQAMPASFAYLLCLGRAIKTSPNWLAMAGVTRGIVPNLVRLRTDKVLSNVIAEDYQPKWGSEKNCISINAITNVKPYGLTIWGNRTLKKVASKGTVATNFLNTRNMISDIKKLAYNTAKSLMFEQDSDTLWLSFKSGVSPLLDQLKSGSGISDYKLIKNTTKYDGRALTRGEMSAIIKIFPIYAIEYFEITVVVSDNDVAIS